MPKYIKVLGKKVKVIYTDEIEEHGLFVGDKLTIKISTLQTEQQQRITLAHEILHAIFFIGGLSFTMSDDNEEAIVRAIEHGFFEIVGDANLFTGE